MGGRNIRKFKLELLAVLLSKHQTAPEKGGQGGKKLANPMLDFCLTELLNGSLVGHALTDDNLRFTTWSQW